MDQPRIATVSRSTKETSIFVALSIDGGEVDAFPVEASASIASTTSEEEDGPKHHAGEHAKQLTGGQIIEVDSGIGFLDHMIHAMAKHAGWSLRLKCRGDLHSESMP
jgi:imidazoleglycerol-phosphate dehydratase